MQSETPEVVTLTPVVFFDREPDLMDFRPKTILDAELVDQKASNPKAGADVAPEGRIEEVQISESQEITTNLAPSLERPISASVKMGNG